MKRDRKRRQWIVAVCLVAVLALAAGGLPIAVRELYPLRYTETIEACAAACDITPSLLYGVVRTESRFRAEAESSAGAKGLMQLTEAAFLEAQKKRDGSVTLSVESMTDPTVNLTYGSYYLALMLRSFSDVSTALAAYNAGPNRVRGWLSNTDYSTDGETLTHIPYPETADYVERVLLAQRVYRRMYSIE